jgi:c-di-GMP-binding flagellar brake protein YcgR
MPRKKQPSPAPGEKRKDSRIREEDKVVVELLSEIDPPPAKRVFNALTKDISPGGIRLMTNVILPVNSLVRMELVLSKRRKLIQATGKVRWTRSVYGEELFEMGVEFTEIDLEDKMVLLEHTYKKG